MEEELDLNYALHFPDIIQNENEFKLLKEILYNLVETLPSTIFDRYNVAKLYIKLIDFSRTANLKVVLYDEGDIQVMSHLKLQKYIVFRIDKLYSDYAETNYEGLGRFFTLIKMTNGR